MSALQYIFGFFLLILYIVTGFYITQSSVYLGPFTDDPNIQIAHKYSTIAAIIPWLLIAISIVFFILYVYLMAETGGELQLAEAKNAGSSWGPTIFFIIILILITISGILSSIAAHYIQISNTYASGNQQVKSAFTDALIASGFCVGVVLIIIFVLIYNAIPESQPETQQQIKLNKL